MEMLTTFMILSYIFLFFVMMILFHILRSDYDSTYSGQKFWRWAQRRKKRRPSSKRRENGRFSTHYSSASPLPFFSPSPLSGRGPSSGTLNRPTPKRSRSQSSLYPTAKRSRSQPSPGGTRRRGRGGPHGSCRIRRRRVSTESLFPHSSTCIEFCRVFKYGRSHGFSH